MCSHGIKKLKLSEMHKKTALHNRLVYGEKYISIEMLI